MVHSCTVSCWVTLTFPFHSHAEHAVPAAAASGVLREGNRRVDVFMLRFRVPVAYGVRSCQQLYGAGGN